MTTLFNKHIPSDLFTNRKIRYFFSLEDNSKGLDGRMETLIAPRTPLINKSITLDELREDSKLIFDDLAPIVRKKGSYSIFIYHSHVTLATTWSFQGKGDFTFEAFEENVVLNMLNRAYQEYDAHGIPSKYSLVLCVMLSKYKT